MKGRVCLVTGAAGFIGSHLLRRLVNAGAQVHALVRPGSSLDRIEDCQHKVRLHHADLRDAGAVREALAAANPQFVFHLGSQNRGINSPGPQAAQDAIEAIVQPLIGLIEAAATLPDPPHAFFRAGTIAEYGRSALPFRERNREAPVNPYGAAMLAATHFLEMLEPALPFHVLTARLALTYGPDQSDKFLIPQLVDACLEGRRFEIQRPDDRRDLIHVDDVVSAFLAFAETRHVRSGVLNVCTGAAPSMREVAAEIIAATRCDPALIEQHRPAPGEAVSELRCDPSLARERYAWSARIPLRQGLSRLISTRREQLASTRSAISAKVHG